MTDRRASEEFGNGGPSHGTGAFSFEVPAGSAFAGIFGASSDRLHQLGMLVGPAVTAAIGKQMPMLTPTAPPMALMPMSPAAPAAPAPPTPAPTGAAAMLTVGPIPAVMGSGSNCPQPRGVLCNGPMGPFQWQRAANGTVPSGSLQFGEIAVTGGVRRATFVCRAYLRRGDSYAGTLNGSMRGTGDTGCQVVVDSGVDVGGRRALIAREYEVLQGRQLDETWYLNATEGEPPQWAPWASEVGDRRGSICLKAPAASGSAPLSLALLTRRGVVGRVGPGSGGCVIVSGGRITVLRLYQLLLVGGS